MLRERHPEQQSMAHTVQGLLRTETELSIFICLSKHNLQIKLFDK